MGIDYKAVGKQIKETRIQANMTQESLAESTQLSTLNISNIEDGKTKLKLTEIVKIADVLSVTVDDLLSDSLIQSKDTYDIKLANLLEDCSNDEMRILKSVTKATKEALRNNPRSE